MRVDDSAEPTSQPCQSHRKPDNPVLAIPGSWVWSCLAATIYFKRKFAFWEIFPATQTRQSATTTFQGPGQTQLLPQCSVARKRLRLSRKEFLPAPGSLLTLTSEVFPTRGGLFPWDHPDGLHHEHEDGLVGKLCSAMSTRVEKSWNRGFQFPVFGGFRKRWDHKDHFWAQTYDGDIVSSQGKTKCPFFKFLPKVGIQGTLRGEESGRLTVLYRLPRSKFREKNVLGWKHGFLEEPSHLYNINFLSSQ